MKVSWAGLLLVPVLAGPPARTQTPPPAAQMAPAAKVAATPPMGWNSWDAYGLTITEEQFRANAKVEANRAQVLRLELRRYRRGLVLLQP